MSNNEIRKKTLITIIFVRRRSFEISFKIMITENGNDRELVHQYEVTRDLQKKKFNISQNYHIISTINN